MSYIEAKEDGIPKIGRMYQIPCSICKKRIVRSGSYQRSKTYKCEMCKSIAKGKLDEENVLKKEVKFQDAISRIETMVDDIAEYSSSIEKVHKVLHRVGWFNSTEEIMVAIELIKNGIRTIHQQKIGKYRVDFALPDYKVLLEIDGKPFHHDLEKEGIRDGKIILMIGCDWEIVRIDTDKINSDISKLVPSIKSILEYREKEKIRLHKK